jgi:hypothetical protein
MDAVAPPIDLETELFENVIVLTFCSALCLPSTWGMFISLPKKKAADGDLFQTIVDCVISTYCRRIRSSTVRLHTSHFPFTLRPFIRPRRRRT